MTEQEFEQLWQANRQQLLANDEEYQRISKSYTSSSWLDYLVSIGGFVICKKFIEGFNLGSVWTFLLAALGMIIISYGLRIIKARLSSNKTLVEVEQRIKELDALLADSKNASNMELVTEYTTIKQNLDEENEQWFTLSESLSELKNKV